jgi:hypothetical protein
MPVTSHLTRRRFLETGAALPLVALAGPASTSLRANGRRGETPGLHHEPLAKHVIFLYMSGGYSHVDTFDPKPRLLREHDVSIGTDPKNKSFERFLKAPLWQFRANRRCGTEVSDLFPHLREVMHEVALIRSMRCDHRDHGEATLQLHTGSTTVAMPSLGAWLSYGLGSFNKNLPSHVVIAENRPYGGAQQWDSGFLPGMHRGVRVLPGDAPFAHLTPRVSRPDQDLRLGLLAELNRTHLERSDQDPRLRARMATFEAARGLQEAAPEALDLSKEPDAVFRLYGARRDDRESYAAQCIMARRMIERGVRFVEIVDAIGACSNNWDSAHRDVALHDKYARRVDQPIGALIKDLKQRGLFDDTLLVFCTEFGRSPWAQSGKGTKSRTHHPAAFSCWLAGGGVRRGIVHGQTDDIGNEVVEDPVHVHDLHATILHIMGFDHERLTYHHAGRDFRLTDVYGRVVEALLAYNN